LARFLFSSPVIPDLVARCTPTQIGVNNDLKPFDERSTQPFSALTMAPPAPRAGEHCTSGYSRAFQICRTSSHTDLESTIYREFSCRFTTRAMGNRSCGEGFERGPLAPYGDGPHAWHTSKNFQNGGSWWTARYIHTRIPAIASARRSRSY